MNDPIALNPLLDILKQEPLDTDLESIMEIMEILADIQNRLRRFDRQP